jgi:hypothetical protein
MVNSLLGYYGEDPAHDLHISGHILPMPGSNRPEASAAGRRRLRDRRRQSLPNQEEKRNNLAIAWGNGHLKAKKRHRSTGTGHKVRPNLIYSHVFLE